MAEDSKKKYPYLDSTKLDIRRLGMMESRQPFTNLGTPSRSDMWAPGLGSRTDDENHLVAYMVMEGSIEDSLLLSQSLAEQMTDGNIIESVYDRVENDGGPPYFQLRDIPGLKS